MSPQPLSNVRRDAKVLVLDTAADLRPRHAQRAARAIAIASNIEAQIIGVFAEMLGAKAEPAAAIFMALRSANAQTAAIEAVAEVVLSGEDAEIFLVVQEIIAAAAVHRNRFAHWLWAYCEELPEALLLVDPTAHRSYSIEWTLAAAEIADGKGVGRFEGLKLEPKDVLVYQLSDMDDAVKLLDRANGLIHLLRVVFSKTDPLADHLRGVLNVQREIAEGLARRRRNRAKTS
jgi:hypothetical protein